MMYHFFMSLVVSGGDPGGCGGAAPVVISLHQAGNFRVVVQHTLFYR